MADSRTSQFIERIPVGPLALMPLKSIEPLGKKVNDYLVTWRTKRESEHITLFPQEFPDSEHERQREKSWSPYEAWTFT